MSITMSDLNNRVAKLEGKSSSTPITMSDLKNRIEALEARPVKDWAILNASAPYGEYVGWNWIPIAYEATGNDGVTVRVNVDTMYINPRGARQETNYNLKTEYQVKISKIIVYK